MWPGVHWNIFFSSNGDAKPDSSDAPGIGIVNPAPSFCLFALGRGNPRLMLRKIGAAWGGSIGDGEGALFINWEKAEGVLCAAVELRARIKPGRVPGRGVFSRSAANGASEDFGDPGGERLSGVPSPESFFTGGETISKSDDPDPFRAWIIGVGLVLVSLIQGTCT